MWCITKIPSLTVSGTVIRNYDTYVLDDRRAHADDITVNDLDGVIAHDATGDDVRLFAVILHYRGDPEPAPIPA